MVGVSEAWCMLVGNNPQKEMTAKDNTFTKEGRYHKEYVLNMKVHGKRRRGRVGQEKIARDRGGHERVQDDGIRCAELKAGPLLHRGGL